jgi:hypothetical protein
MKVTITYGQVTFIAEGKDDEIMATLAEVQAGIADLQATGQAVEDGLDQLLVTVQALKDQVAAGGAATAADLDALMTQIAQAKQPLSDALSKESTA